MTSVCEAVSLPPEENIQPNTISSQSDLNVTSVPMRQTQLIMQQKIAQVWVISLVNNNLYMIHVNI